MKNRRHAIIKQIGYHVQFILKRKHLL